MKKSQVPFLLLVTMGLITMESCERKGCTDETASNYDEKAVVHDNSCKFDGCTDETAINHNEVATDDDGTCMTFSGFTTAFAKESSQTGYNPSVPTHMQNDSTVTRDIYFLNTQDPSGGAYPAGTMIAKHAYNEAGDQHEYTGMVKQEAGFNNAGGDWEWFMLNADGTVATDADGIEMRGANLMNGICLSCHSGASTDFVFTK